MGPEPDRIIRGLALEQLKTLRVAHPGWSLDDLSEALGVPLNGPVRELALAAGFGESEEADSVGSLEVPFGAAPYGTSGYGGSRRARSVGSVPVDRLVSAQGQTSYGGVIYSLGRRYRGQVTNIVERTHELIFFTPGLPTLTRMKRRKV